jgi:hypothetical protein
MQVPEGLGVDRVEANHHVHLASGQSCAYFWYRGKDLYDQVLNIATCMFVEVCFCVKAMFMYQVYIYRICMR